MDIQTLCYELYKIVWMRRISTQRKIEAIEDYYLNINMSDYPFEKYLEENGYSGELYVYFDEFLESEYTDKGYMKLLLNNDELFQEYLNDIKI